MLSSQEATIFNSDDRVSQVELLTDDVIKKIAKKHNFGHLQQVRAPKNPKNPAFIASYSRPFFYFYIPKLAPKQEMEDKIADSGRASHFLS